MTIRFRHRGAQVFLEESQSLPVVDLVFRFGGGSLSDPEGQGGLTRVTGRLLRRGTRQIPAAEVDARIAELGARLSVTISRSALALQGSVLARNVEPFVALVASLLREPAFRGSDLSRAKRRIKASLLALRDDDYGLASRHLQRHIFGEHPYSRPSGGTHASIGRLRRADLLAQHEQLWCAGNLTLGAAGAITEAELRDLLTRHFGDVPRGRAVRPTLRTPKMAPGRRLLIVDKRDRTQTQLGVATLGIRATDSVYMPFLVADAAFGGMFTSRLMQAVRAERGWSYSAYSSFGAGRQRDAWRMWTHPSTGHARDCLALQLDLLQAWAEGDHRGDEVRRAKRYLRGSRCFDEDTAFRRLEVAMSVAELKQSDEHLGGFRKAIGRVTLRQTKEAVRQHIKPSKLALVAVGDARELAPSLGSLPGIRDVKVVPYDARL
ncbi:MAG: pitrilysin family protein [Myxococcota bacterium]